MEYKFGNPIPVEDIVKRFKDEDGEIFLEVRGLEEVLFRVTEGNRVYYKIDKSKMEGENLTLLDDFSLEQDKFPDFPDEPVVEPGKNKKKEESDVFELGKIFAVGDDIGDESGWDEETLYQPVKKKPKDTLELDEGRQIPEKLKSRCKKNEYGGYSLRYGKFLYMLDQNYHVELKSVVTDADSHIQAEEKDEEEVEQELEFDSVYLLTEPVGSSIDAETGAHRQKETELEKGEILPIYLRSQCEEDIGPGGGRRITIGSYLYFLDARYTVTQKMKISSIEEEPVEALGFEEKSTVEEPLVVKKIVSNLIKTVEFALEKYGISADFFKETVLGPGNRDIMACVYQGDLTQLNDDTREASAQGKTTALTEKGFALLKAALVHELYIKSTVSGRGDNMKYFLTYIAAARPDGTLGNFEDNISLEDQKKTVEFFRSLADSYPDKTEIIMRVYRHLKVNVFDEYDELREEGKKVRFNAYLIMKLYQQTNRLDRGDGITMIRLCRDLMETASVSSQ